MSEWIELIKAAVRPFLVVWGFIAYTICILSGIEVPALLIGLVTAVVAEYFGERAIKRLKETNIDYKKLAEAMVKYQETLIKSDA